jgi:hypothetical protein
MYPEDDLRREFWQFVRWRAADTRIQYDDPLVTHTLNELEDNRDGYLISMYDNTHGPEEFRYGFGDGPVVYMRLQDALLAFLIYRVSSDGGFPYSYETWLRTVVLVVAQAQREPSLLTVRVQVDPNEDHLIFRSSDPQAKSREFTMALDGDWGCLSREAFDTTRETLAKRGLDSPATSASMSPGRACRLHARPGELLLVFPLGGGDGPARPRERSLTEGRRR